jgi:hypothetical protein
MATPGRNHHLEAKQQLLKAKEDRRHFYQRLIGAISCIAGGLLLYFRCFKYMVNNVAQNQGEGVFYCFLIVGGVALIVASLKRNNYD